MAERVDTVVIGAGQAGLATSYHLTLRGREHVVLERGRIGETWRSARWDGFFLNTPNWTLALPGAEYDGAEPDAFTARDGVVSYIQGYAESSGAPVRERVGVTALRSSDGGHVLDTDDGPLEAANVVVAAGAYQLALRPSASAALPADVLQLDATSYRSPAQLPDGAVLVCGSGQSGCQIAEELLRAGRRVHLSVGRCPWFPRRLHGRDVLRWAVELGMMDETVDTLPSPEARLACNPALSGNEGGRDCNPRTLAREGAVLVGRVEGCEHRTLLLGGGLAETLAAGDEFEATIRRRIGDHIEREGLDVPPEPPAEPPVDVPEPPRQLDLGAAGIASVVWACGYRPDFSWIEALDVDGQGWPRQSRGETDRPGLYFVGLHWLHKRKSSLLFGVGEDAEHVVTRSRRASRAS